jgi:hypothetical protein
MEPKVYLSLSEQLDTTRYLKSHEPSQQPADLFRINVNVNHPCRQQNQMLRQVNMDWRKLHIFRTCRILLVLVRYYTADEIGRV